MKKHALQDIMGITVWTHVLVETSHRAIIWMVRVIVLLDGLVYSVMNRVQVATLDRCARNLVDVKTMQSAIT